MYSEKDFSLLKLKVFGLADDTDLTEHFKEIIKRDMPSVREYTSNGGKTSVNRLLRYIAYAYDENSPLVRDIEDVQSRLHEAAYLAGFNGNGFDPVDNSRLFDLTFGEYNKVVGYETKGNAKLKKQMPEPVYGDPVYPMAHIVCEYVVSQKSYEFKMLLMSERIFTKNFAKVMSPTERTKDSEQELKTSLLEDKLSDINGRQIDRISTYRNKIFGENKMVEDIIREKVIMSPEDFID